MRYALISDIHANLPALEAVLADIARRRCRRDVSSRVIWSVTRRGLTRTLRDCVRPAFPASPGTTTLPSPRATSTAAAGTRTRVRKSCRTSRSPGRSSTPRRRRRGFSRSLPFRIDLRPLGGHSGGPTVTLLHGNQGFNTVYVHEDRSDEFLAKMATAVGAKAGDVVGFGHTHKPWHRVVADVHFVNTGSVGRPKDGDPRAGYILLDVGEPDRVGVEIVRVDYDVEHAAKAIVASSLPDDFADHLQNRREIGGGDC